MVYSYSQVEFQIEGRYCAALSAALENRTVQEGDEPVDQRSEVEAAGLNKNREMQAGQVQVG